MPNNITKKFQYPLLEKSQKVIAFEELTMRSNSCSQRTAAKLLKTSRTTLRDWKSDFFEKEQVASFFTSSAGAKLLHRIVMAAHFVIQFRGSGIRCVGEFISYAGLGTYVAHSHGAIHSFSRCFENSLINIGQEEREALAQKMKRRKIILAEDETFHQGRPCLVAIDVLSNFILLEKYAEQRRVEDWDRVVQEALKGLDVEIISATTDEGTAVTSHVKNVLQVERSPDLFHVQQEISKACAASLRSQEQAFEKELIKEKEKLQKLIAKHGEKSEKVAEQALKCRYKDYGHQQRKERRRQVQAANRGIGDSFHPVSLEDGSLQSAETIRIKLEGHLDEVEKAANAADLRKSSLQRISKARKMIAPLSNYLAFFLLLLKSFLTDLKLTDEEEVFFKEILFPLAYLERVKKKRNKERKVDLLSLLKFLEAKAREGPIQRERLEFLRSKADEISQLFQRSSSCVEGRNRVLSMMHHGFHGLSPQRLQALTVVHNFCIYRSDGTTAAERFFGQKHSDVFEELLKRVKIPNKPRKKWRHDRNGTKPKRLAA